MATRDKSSKASGKRVGGAGRGSAGARGTAAKRSAAGGRSGGAARSSTLSARGKSAKRSSATGRGGAAGSSSSRSARSGTGRASSGGRSGGSTRGGGSRASFNTRAGSAGGEDSDEYALRKSRSTSRDQAAAHSGVTRGVKPGTAPKTSGGATSRDFPEAVYEDKRRS